MCECASVRVCYVCECVCLCVCVQQSCVCAYLSVGECVCLHVFFCVRVRALVSV